MLINAFSLKVLDLLWGNDRKDENLLNFVNTTMMGLVRMPYSNNWRVPEAKIRADCPTCTVPAASGMSWTVPKELNGIIKITENPRTHS